MHGGSLRDSFLIGFPDVTIPRLVFLISLLTSSLSAEVPDEPGRLAFTLAENANDKADISEPSPLVNMMQAFTKSNILEKFIQYIGDLVGGPPTVSAQADAPQPPRSPHVIHAAPRPPSDAVRREFELSLSHDAAPETVPTHRISDEPFAGTLFGDRGVLTAIFNLIDAKRKNELARLPQNDQFNAKIKDLDFMKIFESLLGGGKDGQFDSGPELPEFLGICNRLSCGDIYKAIDQFRTSEFFSNFQTALQLIQDPKGWEILGKMLTNPEMIASFTGGSAGAAGLSEMFGSALGKDGASSGSETNIDGDFGTDFSSQDKSGLPSKLSEGSPDISFNADGRPEAVTRRVGGGKEDYYAAVAKNIDEDFDIIDVDKEIEGVEAPVPPVSFSIDEDQMTEETVDKTIDVAVPKTIDEKPPTVISTTVTSSSTVAPKSTTVHAVHRTNERIIRNTTEIYQANSTTTIMAPTTTNGKPTTKQASVASTASSTTGTATTNTSIFGTTRQLSTSRANRIHITMPARPSTTTKNFRKDDDYYAMYYDAH